MNLKNKVIDFIIFKPKTSLLLSVLFLFPLIGGVTKIKEFYGAEIWYQKSNPMIKELEKINDNNKKKYLP